MNQKWEAFKYELNNISFEEKKKALDYKLKLFDEFIEPYKNQQIRYGSRKYKEISVQMSNLGLRKDKFETVYKVAIFHKIPFKYVRGNIVFI